MKMYSKLESLSRDKVTLNSGLKSIVVNRPMKGLLLILAILLNWNSKPSSGFVSFDQIHQLPCIFRSEFYRSNRVDVWKSISVQHQMLHPHHLSYWRFFNTRGQKEKSRLHSQFGSKDTHKLESITNSSSHIRDLINLDPGQNKTKETLLTKSQRESIRSGGTAKTTKSFDSNEKVDNRKNILLASSEITGSKTLQLNQTVTYADLLMILNSYQFGPKPIDESESFVKTSSAASKLRTANTRSEVGRGGVALPQQSKLTSDILIRSTTVVSGFLAYLISRSIQQNLWLLGFIVGALYGHRIGIQYTSIRLRNFEGDGDLLKDMSRNFIDNFLLSCGKNLGQWCIKLYDAINVLWYMYKTGELSYAYYKRYESLDKKLKITDKMDAWNARFVEGKLKFDQWEKENEVSRKVLAGLRTFWVLEEKSYKKYAKRDKKASKYRIINIFNDAIGFFNRFFRAILKFITGGGSKELDELVLGVKIELSELNFEILGQQIGSGLAALVMLNLIGALFLVSPGLTGTIVFAGGCIWPTWIGGAYRRIVKTINEKTEKGRRQVLLLASAGEGKYHYFVRKDGSKRWYRTGTPVLGERLFENRDKSSSLETTPTVSKKIFSFPWRKYSLSKSQEKS